MEIIKLRDEFIKLGQALKAPAKKQTSTVIKMCMETSRIAKHTSDTPHCKTLPGKVNGEDFPVH